MKKEILLKVQMLLAFLIVLACGLVHLFFLQLVIELYCKILSPYQLSVLSFMFIATGWGITFGGILSYFCAYYESKKEIDIWIISLITSVFLFTLGLGEVFMISSNPFSWVLAFLATLLLANDVLIKITMKKIANKTKKRIINMN